MKKNIITLLFLISISLLFLFNAEVVRGIFSTILPQETKKTIKTFIIGKDTMNEIENYKKFRGIAYNHKSLPKTQFIELETKRVSLKKINLKGPNQHYKKGILNPDKAKFFIEEKNGKIFIVDSEGKIFSKNIKDLTNVAMSWKKIESNLEGKDIYDVLDTKIIGKELFVSLLQVNDRTENISPNQKCKNYLIAKANINQNSKWLFEDAFKFDECLKQSLGGRIAPFLFNGEKGLIMTTGAIDKEKKLAQDLNSIAGKTLFLNLNNKTFKIFSIGHRNPQGLSISNGNILITEHGPRGGDEINLIKFNKNYGWSVSSYGEEYKTKDKNLRSYKYKKNHTKLSFQEPIFSFVPSIGISEILRIPNEFSNLWSNNYIVASLGAESIYRILFDDDFNKIIFKEKIFINDRVRDIKYVEDDKSLLLSLENIGGEILILKAKND